MDTTLTKVAIRHADHIMADITGFDSQYLSRKIPEMVMTQFLGMLKETFGTNKLLFGTDWPWWELTAPTIEWVKYIRKMKVPLIVRPFGFPSLEDEDKQNIMSDNAHRLLNIPQD
jgi:predicted TIM-barrel fold metal-dependent hydrolase